MELIAEAPDEGGLLPIAEGLIVENEHSVRGSGSPGDHIPPAIRDRLRDAGHDILAPGRTADLGRRFPRRHDRFRDRYLDRRRGPAPRRSGGGLLGDHKKANAELTSAVGGSARLAVGLR